MLASVLLAGATKAGFQDCQLSEFLEYKPSLHSGSRRLWLFLAHLRKQKAAWRVVLRMVFEYMRLPVSGTHVHNFSDPVWFICRCTKQVVGAIVKGKRNSGATRANGPTV